VRQAVALGLLHGPSELVPVSSSGHTSLLAWSRGWDHGALDPAARKRFEVALHAGTIAALAIAGRRGRGARRRSPLRVVVLACVPPALTGALLARPIERRLGTPATIAAGLAGGALAMALAERGGDGGRRREDAGLADALALGAAQAVALIPGVSRSGAARSAARWRGFTPADAEALSAAVGLPITIGALAFKGREALSADRREWTVLGAGSIASCCSTLAAASVAARIGPRRSLLPYAGYRVALAAAVIRRLRQNEGQ